MERLEKWGDRALNAAEKLALGAGEVFDRLTDKPTPVDKVVTGLFHGSVSQDQGVAAYNRIANKVNWNTLWGGMLLLASTAMAPKRLILGAATGAFMIQFSNSNWGKIAAWTNKQEHALPYAAVMALGLVLFKAKGLNPLAQLIYQPLATAVAVSTGYLAANRLAKGRLI